MLDDVSRRRDFPSLADMTYLNTAAEGIPPIPVLRALEQYFRDRSRGAAGRAQHNAEYQRVRELTAEFYGLTPREVGLCSCTSEAFNLLALALGLAPGDEVVVNDLDFPAGRTPWTHFVGDSGVRLWSARDGALRGEDLTPLLNERTRLVVTSLVSYFNGYTLDVAELRRWVAERCSAVLAVDVTQGLGRIPLRLAGADFIVSSTHKWIGGPHGGGLVGIPSAGASRLAPPAGGWYNFEDPFSTTRPDLGRRLEGAAAYQVGMPNFPAVYGIRAALEYVRATGVGAIDSHARPLLHRCLAGLRELGVELITPDDDRSLAGILAFRHPAMTEIHHRLAEQGIQIMCSSGRLRIAIHGYNTAEDVERFLSVLGNLLEQGGAERG